MVSVRKRLAAVTALVRGAGYDRVPATSSAAAAQPARMAHRRTWSRPTSPTGTSTAAATSSRTSRPTRSTSFSTRSACRRFDPATGAVGCNILDPWADYQQVYWTGDNTVDGVARRPQQPGPAPVRQLQPADEAEGGEPEPEDRDLARRLDEVDLVLRPRRDAGAPAGVRVGLHRHVHQGQPAGRRLAAERGRRRRGGRPVRRHRPRLGVPDPGGRRQRRRQRRPTGTTRPCWRPSSASSSTRTARRPASTTCSPRRCRRRPAPRSTTS